MLPVSLSLVSLSLVCLMRYIISIFRGLCLVSGVVWMYVLYVRLSLLLCRCLVHILMCLSVGLVPQVVPQVCSTGLFHRLVPQFVRDVFVIALFPVCSLLLPR